MQGSSSIGRDDGPQESWQTADLARIRNLSDVWELTTFWNAPDGTEMATLERLKGNAIMIAYSPVADLHPVT